ncbi:MAG: Ni/Fe-hydrogenase cytochrome b subunit [Acidobacteria bacterium]|nr:Ni/Fe-hydrogenase cytochrome b subunit [Acidobacteriota bacterium]
MSRARRLKFVLWAIVGLAAAVGTTRMLVGLGATSHLSDATPWGLWIGFDVMAGVALAAGGFIITASVYIFKLERFHDVVRPAVLTAFLGYLAVVVGLLFDLGLPWNIWHMIVFWNTRSPLFEVGWCVMLYLTVLALEFFPVPAEQFSALAKIRRVLLKWRLPLVIAGIGLSTLHQSSLGSLFLAMPYHVHPLWYSPWLPVLFLVSAIALGLQMVIVESHFTAYVYRRKPETGVLEGLTTPARWILLAYLALRFGDLAARGNLRLLTGGEWQVKMFWFEVAVMAGLPIVLLSIGRVRRSRAGQFAAAGLGVFGVVLNRVDVGGLVHTGRGEALYVPAWTEFAVSAGVVAAAVLAFLFAVERFAVWHDRPADPDADPLKLPEFDKVGTTWLGVPAVADRTVYSLVFVVAAAVGFALLPASAAAGRGVEPGPAHRARGGEILWIDGNLDGNGVAFPHDAHEQREGGKESCPRCHHMNLPRDRASGCFECHRDMWQPTDAFGHERHASPTGGRLSCATCHPSAEPRSASTAKTCVTCHKDLIPAGAFIKVNNGYRASGYVRAMHALCIDCHTHVMAARKKPNLGRCTNCHRERRSFVDAPDLAVRERIGASVVLPQGVAR